MTKFVHALKSIRLCSDTSDTCTLHNCTAPNCTTLRHETFRIKLKIGCLTLSLSLLLLRPIRLPPGIGGDGSYFRRGNSLHSMKKWLSNSCRGRITSTHRSHPSERRLTGVRNYLIHTDCAQTSNDSWKAKYEGNMVFLSSLNISARQQKFDGVDIRRLLESVA